MQVRHIGKMAGAVFCSVVALAAFATPAQADAPDVRILAGVGSDTTQDVLNGLSEVVVDRTDADGDGDTTEKVIASWNAAGATPTIKTKATGCEFARPNGSGAGRTALRNSETPGSATEGCVDFARSSSGPVAGAATGTWVKFGVDAVTYAVADTSDLPDTLTTVQLKRIYKCLDTDILGTPVVPLLIQAGSGTRSFWLSQMGITEPEIANGDYPCLKDLDNGVQENNGTVLAGHPEYLMPFSIAQFIAQGNSLPDVVDRRGPARLGAVQTLDGTVYQPTVNGALNTTFPYRRDVYNIVPTADVAKPVIADTFIGADSQICQNGAVIQQYGFGYDAAACGSTLTGQL